MMLRYLHTLLCLKPVQIYYRPIFLFKRKFVRACNSQALENLAAHARKFKAGFRKETGGIVWFDESLEKFYRYRLNSFEGVVSPYCIFDWIEHNTDEYAESWEPYVISRRVSNWVKWLEESTEVVKEIVVESIFWQLKRLAVDIEYHLQANHLFENYKALFIGAALLRRLGVLDQKSIGKWLAIGQEGLRVQFQEQILVDGAHYERSPMYHAIVLDGVRQIRKYADRALAQKCDTILTKMELWLSYMTHPDGKIALFQDSALENGQRSLSEGVILFEPSGYFVRRWGNGNYFVMDCGEPSPSYQPAHAHCSALSYELSLNGQRVVIDSGCGSYQNQEIRTYCRSTAAHNVPMVDGVEQSEIWGAFRMGRRIKVLSRNWDAENQTFRCRIRDYQGNVFRRMVTFLSDEIRFEDSIEKIVSRGRLCSLIHLAPGILSELVKTSHSLEVLESDYCPEFGKPIKNSTVRLGGDSSEHLQYSVSVSR